MSIDMRGNGRVNRAFTGIPTFLRSNLCADLAAVDADAVVLGVPMDDGSPYMSGARFAPRSIREHSMRFSPGGFFDVDSGAHYLPTQVLDGRIVDGGDVDVYPTNVEKTFDTITQTVHTVLERRAMPVIMGGDHSISYPVVRAFSEPLYVVQLDAHMDFAPTTADLQLTNGHPFRNISSLAHVQGVTQIGIRSLRVRPVERNDSESMGNTVITMGQFRRIGVEQALASVPVGANCYVSIDIDALDMALVPGCVSAEPDGMSHAELRDVLRMLARRTRVVGFDLVEINPQLDVGTGVTSYLGAHIMVEFLGHIFANR